MMVRGKRFLGTRMSSGKKTSASSTVSIERAGGRARREGCRVWLVAPPPPDQEKSEPGALALQGIQLVHFAFLPMGSLQREEEEETKQRAPGMCLLLASPRRGRLLERGFLSQSQCLR